MKVILLADVKPLGKRGDVADVADGYANNYLLRRKLAADATAGAIKQLEQQNNAKKRRQAEEVANAQDVATPAREQAALEIPAKAGGNGRLFGTVTNAQRRRRDPGAAQRRDRPAQDRDEGRDQGGRDVSDRGPLGNNVVAKSNIRVVAAK